MDKLCPIILKGLAKNQTLLVFIRSLCVGKNQMCLNVHCLFQHESQLIYTRTSIIFNHLKLPFFCSHQPCWLACTVFYHHHYTNIRKKRGKWGICRKNFQQIINIQGLYGQTKRIAGMDGGKTFRLLIGHCWNHPKPT